MESIAAQSEQVSIDAGQAVITPGEFLPYETELYVLADEGFVEDIAGNPWIGIANEDTWIFSTVMAPAVELATIAELRDGDIGTRYTLTGEAVISFQQEYRNQVFIQDETAAILIDDEAEIITTGYSRYDGITGITGILDEMDQMLVYIPEEDPGPPTSTGNELTPLEITLESLIEDHQAMLIQVTEVNFDDAVDNGLVFEAFASYDLSSPGGDGIFHAGFPQADYIGEPVPHQPQVITALVTQAGDEIRITARDQDDFELFVDVPQVDAHQVVIYPNPFDDRIRIRSGMNMTSVRLMDMHGRLVYELRDEGRTSEFTTPDLLPGLYVIRITFEDGSSVMETLMKR